MTRTEAVLRLEKIIDEIYDKLDEMEEILKEVAPEDLERVLVYWMAHFIRLKDTINGALLNRTKDGWGG